jgi:hypothetical protein
MIQKSQTNYKVGGRVFYSFLTHRPSPTHSRPGRAHSELWYPPIKHRELILWNMSNYYLYKIQCWINSFPFNLMNISWWYLLSIKEFLILWCFDLYNINLKRLFESLKVQRLITRNNFESGSFSFGYTSMQNSIHFIGLYWIKMIFKIPFELRVWVWGWVFSILYSKHTLILILILTSYRHWKIILHCF